MEIGTFFFFHIKGSPEPPQPCPSLRHKKLLMLIIARLFAAALYRASSVSVLRALESQKAAVKSPWEEKRVKGRKVEGVPLLGSVRNGKENWREPGAEESDAPGPFGDPVS